MLHLKVDIATCQAEGLDRGGSWVRALDVVVRRDRSIDIEYLATNFFSEFFSDRAVLLVDFPVGVGHHFEVFEHVNVWVLPQIFNSNRCLGSR